MASEYPQDGGEVCCYDYQGRIQDFLKEGALKLRTDRTSVPVGTGGV